MSAIHTKTFFVTLINLFGKSLGFVKTLVIAATFGATGVLDAFWVAYSLPTIFPSIFTIIISTVFIPQFLKSDRSNKDSWNGINTFITVVIVFNILLFFVLYYMSSNIVNIIAPGLSLEVSQNASILFRYMAFATLIMGFSSLLVAIANAYEKFYLTAIESIVVNSLIIFVCLTVENLDDISVVVYAIIAGFSIQLTILVASNFNVITKYIRFKFEFFHPDFIKPLSGALPLVVGYMGAVFIGIADQWFASYEEEGAISILTYAVLLAFLPMEVFGNAVIQTFYPRLSKYFATSNTVEGIKIYQQGLQLIIFILLPATLYLVAANFNLVQIIFERGAFSFSDSVLTSSVVSALALGLLMQGVTYFNYRVLHAAQKSWYAIYIGLTGVLFDVLFNYLLAPKFGIKGIAYATAISLTLQCLLSSLLLYKIYNINYLLEFVFKPFKLLVISALSIFIYITFYSWTESMICDVAGCGLILKLTPFIPLLISFIVFAYIFRVGPVYSFISRKFE